MSTADRGPVFISFASQDTEVADRFLQGIEAAGIRCWIAHRDIAPGTSYPAEITTAIQSCGGMLVIVTAAANVSPHVLREVEMAFNAGKPILPVHLSSVPLSPNLTYFLSTKQWLDAGESFDGDDTERVLRSLRQLLAESPADRAAVEAGLGTHAQGQNTQRPRWLMPAAIALVLILAIGAFLLSGGRDGGGGRDSKRPDSAAAANRAPAGESKSGVSTSTPRAAHDGDPAAGSDAAAGASSSSPLPPKNGASRLNAADGQTYMFIPAGEFTMGCSPGDQSCDSNELPAHQVTIPRPFWIGRTEVTGAQYHKVVPRGGAAVTPDSPVTEVPWAGAKAYCRAIGGRLPKEAEWEYAARAGLTTRGYGPLDSIAWFAKNSEERAHPVGRLKPNRFGLFDMLGNVHEWVLDRYFNKYTDEEDESTPEEPTAPNALAVVRGGAWTSAPKDVRLSARLEREPDVADPNIGFRCVLDK